MTEPNALRLLDICYQYFVATSNLAENPSVYNNAAYVEAENAFKRNEATIQNLLNL